MYYTCNVYICIIQTYSSYCVSVLCKIMHKCFVCPFFILFFHLKCYTLCYLWIPMCVCTCMYLTYLLPKCRSSCSLFNVHVQEPRWLISQMIQNARYPFELLSHLPRSYCVASIQARRRGQTCGTKLTRRMGLATLKFYTEDGYLRGMGKILYILNKENS